MKMNERIYYLRGPNNIHRSSNGEEKVTRGDPVAVVMTYVDRASNTVRYALAAVHPKECFVKSMAKKIVLGRLNVRPVILNGVPETGHKITEMVMRDIFASDMVGNVKISPRVRNLAADWLAQAARPRDERPTIPVGAISEPPPRPRNAIPPPPMMPRLCGTGTAPREFTDKATLLARKDQIATLIPNASKEERAKLIDEAKKLRSEIDRADASNLIRG
jgi:hypothetical protein